MSVSITLIHSRIPQNPASSLGQISTGIGGQFSTGVNNKNEPNAHLWHLLVRRELNSQDTCKYTLSNAPAETSTHQLAQMQGQRFWIERAFEDGKSESGMADYQARKRQSWHHHMALVSLSMLFMVEERERHQEEVPLLSCNDIEI